MAPKKKKKSLGARVRGKILAPQFVDLYNNTAKLRKAAIAAEQRGDLPEASMLWRAYLKPITRGRNTQNPNDALYRLARIEIELNADPAHDGAARLEELWEFAHTTLNRKSCDLLQLSFLKRARQIMQVDDDFDTLLRILAPLCARAPRDQLIYTTAFRLPRFKVLDGWADQDAALAQWWAFCEKSVRHIEEPTVTHISAHTRTMARKHMEAGMLGKARTTCETLIRVFPQDARGLSQMASVCEAQNDWRGATVYWQMSAATSTPIRSTNKMVFARNAKEGKRLAKFALKELCHARFKLAEELYAQGNVREFTETVARAVELLRDHRLMKKDPAILEVLTSYVRQSLASDGFEAPDAHARGKKPKRIAFCFDVLKVGDHYTHSKIVFAISRNLMALDPDIEVHLIITNERLTVSTPTVAPSFNLTRSDVIDDMARAALPEYFGTRFHVHFFKNTGLEGLVTTCKDILLINPDVIVYAGGHTGILSNESRVVRHCLYEHVPTSFFFIQSNNEVDDVFDLIIARGPHAVSGTSSDVPVRIQPYPTLTSETAVAEPEYDRSKAQSKVILSAVAGLRMDIRMEALSDEDLEQLFSILDENPGAIWYFVGSNNPKLLAKKIPLLKERMRAGQVKLRRFMPFDDFEEVATGAALFLQLPGFTGGAGGAGIARRSGVPILTFEHSDVSGRQPAETVFPEEDIASFVRKANMLLSDEDEWERVARAQIAHSHYLRETAPGGFYDCLGQASAAGQKRLVKAGKTSQ